MERQSSGGWCAAVYSLRSRRYTSGRQCGELYIWLFPRTLVSLSALVVLLVGAP